VSGSASRTARPQPAPVAVSHVEAQLSRRAAYGTAALVGFVLGNAVLSVAHHRSTAGALLLLITVLGGLLLLIGNQEAICKRGFHTEAIHLATAAGLFSVLLFLGALSNALFFT